MTDDNQIRPRFQTPEASDDPADLPEWRQVPADQEDTTRHDQGQPRAAPPTAPAEPQRLPAPSGPAWGTIAFGVVCLVVAGGALTLQLVDVTVDWRYAAPLSFVGLGALLLLFGLIGLANRRASD